MKKHALWIFLVFAVMVLTACSSTDDQTSSSNETDVQGESGTSEEIKAPEVIKVGVLASLTGALESYGKQTQKGFELRT